MLCMITDKCNTGLTWGLVDNDIIYNYYIEHFCIDFALREQQEQSTTGTQHQPEEQAESYRRPSASSSSEPPAERGQRHIRPG